MVLKFSFCALLFTLASLFIVFFDSCQGTTKTKGDIVYSTDKYMIRYPATWIIDTSDAPKIEFSLLSPKESMGDDFSENVNLLIQDLAGQNMALDKYTSISEKEIKEKAVELHDFASRKVKDNNREFYDVEYKMTMGGFKLHTKQYYFIENEKGIVLTYTSEIDRPLEMTAMGNKILKSFSYHDK